MGRFIEGIAREQTTLFPECLEDLGQPGSRDTMPLLTSSTYRDWDLTA